jgi:hypothetical protein
MLELTLKTANNAEESRELRIRLHEPTRNPPDQQWPWSITVEVDGRTTTTYGMDPLDAIENGARHAAILVREGHGTTDPPLEPRKS